jgi:hypothetical protein
VVGHGVRRRQLRGPLRFGDDPGEMEVEVRRFRCLRCRAVVSVGPPEALRYRLFSAVAITWALALFGVERHPSAVVRRRISPWRVLGATAARSWRTLRSWLRSATKGQLLPGASAMSGRPRELATRLSYTLAAKAPPAFFRRSISEQAVIGALHSLMGIAPCTSMPADSTTQGHF